jgi:hypothetical protein
MEQYDAAESFGEAGTIGIWPPGIAKGGVRGFAAGRLYCKDGKLHSTPLCAIRRRSRADRNTKFLGGYRDLTHGGHRAAGGLVQRAGRVLSVGRCGTARLHATRSARFW